MTKSKLNPIQSEALNLVRFPLALLVLYIHIGSNVDFLAAADYSFFSGHGISNAMVLFLHEMLPKVAVPAFFTISGYLFFFGFSTWNKAIWIKKLKNRIWSLLIPYLLWNVFGLCCFDIEHYSWHHFWDSFYWNESKFNWWGGSLSMSGPVVVPLWYLRDLMIMTLIAPILQYIIKKIGAWWILFLFVVLCTSSYIYIPGLSMTAILFFSLGAWLQLKSHPICPMSKNGRIAVLLFYVLLMIQYAWFGDIEDNMISHTFFCCYLIFSVIALFTIAVIMAERNIHSTSLLSKSSYFVYIAHPFILNSVFCFIFDVMPGVGLVKYTPSFLLAPLCVILILVVVYWLLSRFLLPFSAPLIGINPFSKK